eukprot:1957060-Alexandrium_andersonii.AAC.1
MPNGSETCSTLIFQRRYQNDSGGQCEADEGRAFSAASREACSCGLLGPGDRFAALAERGCPEESLSLLMPETDEGAPSG